MEVTRPIISIEAIDRQLARRFLATGFESDLEKAYDADTRAEKSRHYVMTGIISLVLYDLFLISDWQMLPDVFVDALICRLLIHTPLCIIAFVVVKPTTTPFIRDVVFSGLSILSVILLTSVFLNSHSQYRVTYHYGPLLIMMFSCVVLRLRVVFAVPTVTAVVAIQIVGMAFSDAFDMVMIKSDAMFFIAAGIIILVAVFFLERDTRRSYLLALRSRLLNDQLEQFAKIDPLTGLWNRRHLEAMMKAAWSAVGSKPISMAVILLDIDHFKAFNDTYGHIEGDLCLQRVSRCLRSFPLGAFDVTRFGGEEFLIFSRDADAAKAQAVAERVRRALHEEAIPHPLTGTNAIVTASFGVAVGLTSDTTPAVLIAEADKALYMAKHAGRDCVSLAKTFDRLAAREPRYAQAV